MVDDQGRPRLADFGLSVVMEDKRGVLFTRDRGLSSSYRWSAPELFGSPPMLSTHSDVFSFGMTVLEVCFST